MNAVRRLLRRRDQYQPGRHRLDVRLRLGMAVALSSLAGMSIVAGAAQASGGSEGVTANSISIGTSSPLTGPVAAGCSPVTEGSNAWFKHVNQSGGINGRMIDYKVLDDEYEASESVSNFRTLVSDNVFAIVGGCGSTEPPAGYPITSAAKIPYLFPYSTYIPLSQPGHPYYFSLEPLYNSQIMVVTKAAFSEYGKGSVAAFNTVTPGISQVISAMKKTVLANGGKWAASYLVPTGTPDMTPYVLKMKAINPKYVILDCDSADCARLIQAMSSVGWYPKKLLAPNLLTAGNFIQPEGKLMNGKIVIGSPTVGIDSKKAAQCVSLIAKSGIQPDGSSLLGCAEAQVFTTAVQALGKNVTRARLMTELNSWRNKEASSSFTPITFSSNRRIGPVGLYILGVKNGKIQTQRYVK